MNEILKEVDLPVSPYPVETTTADGSGDPQKSGEDTPWSGAEG